MTKFTTLECDKTDKIATITLNRPGVLNALNRQLLLDLADALVIAEEENEVKVLIITGKGKHFSVGADINEVQTFESFSDYEDFFNQVHRLFNQLEFLSKPTIAAINGLALGGGLELCLACDVRIATNSSSFGLPEIKLGTVPGAGGTQRLTRIVGISKTLEMIYTGNNLNANEAFRIGLISKLTNPEELLQEARLLANDIVDKSPVALRIAKRLIKDGLNMDSKTALNFENYGVLLLSGTYDNKEGLRAFLEKRKPNFLGK